jgi:hypothetical protein
MKMTTKVGGIEFAWENQADLIRQLETKLAAMDKELAVYEPLKKKRWFVAQALKQMKGEEDKAAKETAPAKV